MGLFHYLDYRPTHDVDSWWSELLTEEQRHEVSQTLEATLSSFGDLRVRSWGDVISVEFILKGKLVFSFQIVSRSARLEEPISANWIDVPLDNLADLVASKMVALVERGAPRDFLDIYLLCQGEILSIGECWAFWYKRQSLAGSDTDASRVRLAIESLLERITLYRPLEEIVNFGQRKQAQQILNWYSSAFVAVKVPREQDKENE